MKFSDGQWLIKKGVALYGSQAIYDYETKDNKLTLYVPTHPINNRGDTLSGPMLTITYSSPQKDIIRVRVQHFEGGINRGPNYKLNQQNANVEIKDDKSFMMYQTGNLSVQIEKNTYQAKFYYEDKFLTQSPFKGCAYITVNENIAYMMQQLTLGVSECVYGFGERFTHFVKNGQTIDIWNEDGGTSSEQAYKNIPFYITNCGYGVFVNHPEKVSFEVASEKVTHVQFSVPGEYIEYYLIGGKSLKDVLRNYTLLTGRPKLVPAWSFGLWLTTSFTTNYDEDTINKMIDGMRNRDLPLHVFHFDCFWMREFEWCNFTWDETAFTNPKETLHKLKDKGLKISVWINPYIAQKSPLFQEAKENDYLLKRKNGDIWQWDLWQPGMGIVDFTNPNASSWFQDNLRNLVHMGVDSFKTDFGERIPTDVCYHDGSDPEKMHNYYAYLYNKTVFELLEEERPNQAIVFSRCATATSQQFPIHWGGDCSSNYESMAETLRGGLSLALSGFSFWSHDISGFENTATSDLYKRWAAFGLLSSHSRLHGNNSYRVPWLFDEEAVDVLRFFTQLKCSLMPYLYQTAVYASKTGVPMIRPMVLEYSHDPACAYLDKQYLLGDSLLVAPIFHSDKHVDYYLPKGKWTHFISGRTIDGGCFQHEIHDYFSLPLMVKPNSIIPVGNNHNEVSYAYQEGIIYHVFEMEEDNELTSELYDTQGTLVQIVSIKRKANTLNIKTNAKKLNYFILLRSIYDLKTIDHGTYQVVKLGLKITPLQNEIRCQL